MLQFEKIQTLLKETYPSPEIALIFSTPFELLAATVLSAQCTDARVNMVTEGLFRKYKSIQDYARLSETVFEKEIRSTGFYRHKAKNIIGCAKKIVKDFNGRVPSAMEELIQLPGVARKTANVVLFGAFKKNEGMAVDTHVARVSQRLGITKNSNPVKIEADLMKLVDKKEWGKFSLRLVWHGRQICGAKKPKCAVCVLREICPSRMDID